jgi:hypothetical protein
MSLHFPETILRSWLQTAYWIISTHMMMVFCGGKWRKVFEEFGCSMIWLGLAERAALF